MRPCSRKGAGSACSEAVSAVNAHRGKGAGVVICEWVSLELTAQEMVGRPAVTKCPWARGVQSGLD